MAIRVQKQEAPKELKYKLQIFHKGELLAEDELDCNAAILDLVREREFNMLHSIDKLATRVLNVALKEYEFNKANPKTDGNFSVSQ